MSSITIDANTSVFSTSGGPITVKVSKTANNGISMNSSGQLVVTKGEDGNPGSGGTANTPGNGVDGTVGKTISVARCNDSVSRRDIEVSLQSDNEISMSTIVAKIKANNKS